MAMVYGFYLPLKSLLRREMMAESSVMACESAELL